MNAKVALGLVVAALAASCTIVTPASPDGGTMPMPFPIPIRPDALPQPKPLEASVLIVANLERSSANLADRYAGIIVGLGAYLQSVGLQVENMGLISTYGDHFGPRLLLGRRAGSMPSPTLGLLLEQAVMGNANVQDYDHLLPIIGGALADISDADLPIALKLLAASGNFDGDGETSEAKNLIAFGSGLSNEPLSPLLGGIERSALFDRPRDLFIIVYLQPLPRRCAMDTSACLVDGRKPSDIFLDTDANGAAAWLNFNGPGMKIGQLLHVAIATSELESLDSFRTRCSKVPGFPQTLFDVMAPSQNAYFTPLANALDAVHPGTGSIGDFCELIGEKPDAALMRLGQSVAGVLGRH